MGLWGVKIWQLHSATSTSWKSSILRLQSFEWRMSVVKKWYRSLRSISTPKPPRVQMQSSNHSKAHFKTTVLPLGISGDSPLCTITVPDNQRVNIKSVMTLKWLVIVGTRMAAVEDDGILISILIKDVANNNLTNVLLHNSFSGCRLQLLNYGKYSALIFPSKFTYRACRTRHCLVV